MGTQLTVYKASAGSGKTFTLAREYMTLVIANPASYRTILAVTFTNKATEEMKTRILGKLYEIARDMPEAADYKTQIQKALPHLSDSQIRQNAATALHLLLHNYNYFRVQTIDTFFQGVLRNLARELDLTANLRIELNDYQVEQQAVDQLIEGLQDTDRLLFWIMDYIKENIDDDKNWNVIGKIKKFGENIFKEYYKENSEKLNKIMGDENFFKDFNDRMKKMRSQAKEQLEEIAATFFDSLAEEGFTADDLAGKTRGIWSYFNKLKNGKYDDEDLYNATFHKCQEDPKAWVKKSDASSHAPIYDYVVSILHPILLFAEDNRHKLVRTFKSADLTAKHLNQLRLLGSIDQKVRESNKEANRFLLSDTQSLLHSLIQDSDSPFIFEKIGTQIDHVMIDEFQDTSTIQWKNFKVLLEETMSRQDAGNLIVGDVKQSIYRWRSGDWRLLNGINNEFTNANQRLDIRNLDTNFRSDRNIIEFNNAFFTQAVKLECDSLAESNPEGMRQLESAYSDVCQKFPIKKTKPQGYVEIRLVSSEDSEEKMKQLTLETVRKLTGQGVPCNKIAILVRSNRIIQSIAEYFMENSDFPLVSDEAFRLDASQAVCTMVTTLQLLAHPQDNIAAATLQKYSDKYLGGEDLPAKLREHHADYLEMPLFDLTERLFAELKMAEVEEMSKQSAYICAFYDKLNKYLVDNNSDIDAFLKEWNESIHEKSIHSDSDNGIRFLTIHKSKGLEYDHVIMPFCDWQLEMPSTLWCRPKEAPYNELTLVPVDYNAKAMRNSIYEADYQQEHLQNIVDNMNLLYVAFTRASHNLFIFGKRATANYRSNIVEASLEEVVKKLESNYLPITLEGLGSDAKTSDILFTYGNLYTGEEKQTQAPRQETLPPKKASGGNVLTRKPIPLEVSISVTPNLPPFKQSNKSRDFIQGDEEEERQKNFIKTGTVLHNLFSTIHTHRDIEGALRQMELDGLLYDDDFPKEKMKDMIRRRLESPKVRDWFSDNWTSINECSILSVEGDKVVEHRPDRVIKNAQETIVIDFKFGAQRDEHHLQVREYIRLLSQMGHPNVKGFLWYVYPNKVVEVNEI